MKSNALITALVKASYTILYALARILLRHGIGFTAFSEIAKRAFIDVAHNEFALPGRKQTVSRISALTGLSRKDVGLVLKQESLDDGLNNIHINRVARVISGWLSDEHFQDHQQHPLDLPFEGDSSFSSLVKRYSGDLTPKTIADELMRINAVSMLPGGKLRLEQHAYVPKDDLLQKSSILGNDVADLIATIDHNMVEPEEAYFQRKVSYQNIDEASMDGLHHDLNHLSQQYLEKMQATIRKKVTAATGLRKKCLGVGIYYFEKDVSDEVNEQQ